MKLSTRLLTAFIREVGNSFIINWSSLNNHRWTMAAPSSSLVLVGVQGSPCNRWRHTVCNAAVHFGIVRHHRFSGGVERIRYRNKSVCAAVQIGIVALLHVLELLVVGGMCVGSFCARDIKDQTSVGVAGHKGICTCDIPTPEMMSSHKHVRTCFFSNAVYGIRQVKMFVALDVWLDWSCMHWKMDVAWY